MIDPAILELARAHLTEKQLAVWLLIHDNGASMRSAALRLDIARTTATDRYDNACRNLHRAGVRFDPSGRPYLEETTVA